MHEMIWGYGMVGECVKCGELTAGIGPGDTKRRCTKHREERAKQLERVLKPPEEVRRALVRGLG